MFGIHLANTLLPHDDTDGEESGSDTTSTRGQRDLRGVSIGWREPSKREGGREFGRYGRSELAAGQFGQRTAEKA